MVFLMHGRGKSWSALVAGVVLGVGMSGAALADPTGATVVRGSATIEQDGSTTTITNTPGTIINWQQFSVAPDEITRFVQQSASSAVLNRVTGSQTSEILGQLVSNGRVFLINPNGIAIGAGARINTAGFVASSLNLSDADFIAGEERFAGTGGEGAVVNRGTIEAASGGAVYLIAPNVENHGVIRAPNGEILLAAGHSAELVSASQPNLRVRISAPTGGEAINVGELVANAGRIGLFGATVRHSGLANASSASINARGEVVLSATGDTYVEAGARIDASNAAGQGGRVMALGERVAVLADAAIDASGAAGGGEILVGGDYLGANADVQNARATVIAPTAQLSADAGASGDGGRVIVWSDDYTGFFGSISARGGAEGGNGGFVETSSRGNLQALGGVDASAAAGTAGTWLLDPYNITINVAANFNGGFSGGNPDVFTPTGNSAIASRDQIQTSLNAGTSVTVATGGAGSPGTQAGTLTVAAPITKSAGGAATLSLNAQSTISFNAGAAVTSTAGVLNLSLVSNAGGITGLPDINLNGGTLTLSGTAAMSQAAGAVISGNASLVKFGAGTLTLLGGQTYTGSTTINAGTLNLGAANALPDTTALTIAAGASMNMQSFNDTVGSLAGGGNITLGMATLTAGGSNASTTYSGVIGGAGGFTKEGTGTLTLSGANSYTGATTINNGTILLGAANRIANASPVTVSALGTLNLNNFAETLGALSGTGSVLLGSATLTVGSGNATSTFDGVISGTGGLTKIGNGTFTLGGANTYTGTTSATAGTLALGAAERIADTSAVSLTGSSTFNLNGFNETIGSLTGTRPVVLGAGTLTTGGNGTSTTFSGAIGGTGGLTKVGAGTFTISGNNTYTGATTINAGTLTLGAANRIANASAVTVAGGATFNLNGFADTIGSLAGGGNVTLGMGTLTTGGDNSSTTYSGVMSGTGGLTKAGTGTMTLGGANTYSGATTINAGTLALGAADRIADASAVTVAAAGTFNLAGFSEAIGSLAGAGAVTLGAGTLTTGGTNATTTYSGVMSGSGGLTKVGTGTMTLSGANTYTGATAINAGTLTLGAANRLSDTTAVTVAGGANFNLNNFAETIGSLAGAGNVALGTATLNTGGNNTSTLFSGVLSGTGGLTKSGTGTMTLGGANAYTGATTINAGTLALGAANRIADASAVTVAGGAAFDLAGFAETIGSLAGAGNVTLGAGTLTTGGNNTSTTFSGVMSGTGGLVKSGTGVFTLSGANTYSGTTTVAAGTLVAASAAALGSTAGGTAVNSGAMLRVSNAAVGAEALTIAGTGVGGAGALTGDGAASYGGQITLVNPATIGTTAAASTLTLNGSVDGAFALTLAGAGRITLNGLVGGVTPLASLTQGATPLTIGTTSIRTSGAQSYGGAVTLASNTTLTSIANGAVSMSNVTGSGFGLNINTGGATTLSGLSGLASLITDAPGTISLSGTIGADTISIGEAAPSVCGTIGSGGGSVSFSGAVTLCGDTTVAGTSVTFASTVNSNATARALTVNSGGVTTFGGAVGAVSALSTLVTDAPGSVSITGSSVRTVGAQTYNDAVTIGGATTLTSTTNGTLTVGGPFNGTAGALTISIGTGTATLTNAANDFSSVTIAGAGDATLVDANALTLNGVTSTGTVTATAAGNLTANGAISAAQLALRSSGADIVLGAGAALTATGAGTPIVLDAAARFINNGATLAPGTGRWVVYSADPALNTFGGLASGNYAVWGQTSGTLAPGAVPAGNRYVFAIAPTLTFTSTDATKVYGDDATALVASSWTVTGFNTNTYGGAFLADDASSTFTGTPLVTSLGAPVTATVVPGSPYAITIAQGSVATTSGYALAFDSAGQLTVSPLDISVVANDATKVYGDPDPLLTYVATGLINGDALSGSLVREPGETVLGGPYAINQGTLANPNYTIAYTPGLFTITPRPMTVVANDGTKVYGDPDPVLTYVATGLIGGDTLAGSLIRDPGETVLGGPYAINQGTLANPNYTIAYTPGLFTITPRPMTVVANDGTKVYGDPDPVLTYVATGLIGGDTLAGSLIRDPGETVLGGPYAINQGTLANPNYAIAYTPGLFTITPRGITVVANDLSKVYGDPDPVLTYVATGLIGGDTLSGSLIRDPGETVLGGPYTINQGTLANPNYTISYTPGLFTITPRPISVIADDLTKDFGQPDPPLTYTTTNMVAGDALSGALVRAPGETPRNSPYLISQGTITDANNPNYLIAFTPGYLTIVPGAVSPESPALQLALTQSATEPFVSACLPIPDGDILGKEFAQAQRRLDRAGGNIRIDSGPVCRATPL